MLDPQVFVGIAGVPAIEQTVEYLRDNMRLPAYLAPYTALLLGVVANVGAAYSLHHSIVLGVIVGLMAGAGASGWHEMAKPSK